MNKRTAREIEEEQETKGNKKQRTVKGIRTVDGEGEADSKQER